MLHPSDTLFDQMRGIVEAPGYPLLQHYKQDFYKFDREQLRATYAPEMTYLWIVREMGTHLFPLYIDPSVTNDAKAALHSWSHGQELYLVGPKGVVDIDLPNALAELGKFDYSVNAHSVMKRGGTLATITTCLVWDQNRLHGKVTYESLLPFHDLTARDRVALLQIALGQVRGSSGSLFTPCAIVTFDGMNLIPERRAQEEGCAA